MEHRKNEKYEQIKDWKERNKESKEREREGNSIKENVPERIWKKSNLEKRRNVTYYFRFIFQWIWHEIKKIAKEVFWASTWNMLSSRSSEAYLIFNLLLIFEDFEISTFLQNLQQPPGFANLSTFRPQFKV